jgi:hypothetical protein
MTRTGCRAGRKFHPRLSHFQRTFLVCSGLLMPKRENEPTQQQMTPARLAAAKSAVAADSEVRSIILSGGGDAIGLSLSRSSSLIGHGCSDAVWSIRS